MSIKMFPMILVVLMVLGGTVFAQAGYYSGYYSIDTTKSKSSPRLAVSAESSCEELVVTVTSGDSPVADSRVTLVALSNADLLGSGDTDADGKVVFRGLCGETVDIRAIKSGYYPGLLTLQLIGCAQCQPGAAPECTSNSDCRQDQMCSNNVCVPVPCPCGVVQNHACVPYECCADNNCPAGQVCRDNVCTVPPAPDFECMSDADCPPEKYCDISPVAAGGSCKDVVCECGVVQNHACVPYECCADNDCLQGKVCVDNSCVLYEVMCPPTGEVAEDVACTVMADGEPCVNCQVEVTGPDGRKYTIMTDENGNFSLPPGEPGEYRVSFPRTGQMLSVQVGAPDGTGEGDEQPGDSPLQWILLLLLLALLGAGIAYLSSRKN